jgi:uracil-DNA glycosylase family 4
VDARRVAALGAMGIPVWVRRGREAPGSEQDEIPPAEMDWSRLEAAVAGCLRCDLHAGRTRTVFGVGHREADWMIIGEAPGAEEDRRGEPFVGRAGKLLDSMLAALGLDRSKVFIANVLKCRPPENRDPRPEEVRACAPYLQRQIELVAPRLILAVGRVAAQRLLETDTSLGRLRGRTHRFGATDVPVLVTYHPAYLLRRPEAKAEAWRDLVTAAAIVNRSGGAS